MARHKAAEAIAELEDLKSNAKRAIRDIDDKLESLSAETLEEFEDDLAGGELYMLNEAIKGTRKMPAQKPGQSKQDYATPMELIQAVEKRFGAIVHDLCAHEQNKRVASYYSKEQDCFKQAWGHDFVRGNLWGNPEFGGGFIARFMEKAYVESRSGREGLIIVLTPASIGAEWFAEHVEGKAKVIGLRPRLSFDGINPYPKDTMLSVYGRDTSEPQGSSIKYLSGFETWRWKPKGKA